MPIDDATETTFLQDILSRLDTINDHIIDIKADSITRSEYRDDKERIYHRIAEVQQETVEAVREGFQHYEQRLATLELSAKEEHEKRHSLPWWAVSVISAGLYALGSQMYAAMVSRFVHR